MANGWVQSGGQGVRIPLELPDFCHVEIFRQTPSGNLDSPPPPPLRKFPGSAHVPLDDSLTKLEIHHEDRTTNQMLGTTEEAEGEVMAM